MRHNLHFSEVFAMAKGVPVNEKTVLEAFREAGFEGAQITIKTTKRHNSKNGSSQVQYRLTDGMQGSFGLPANTLPAEPKARKNEIRNFVNRARRALGCGA